MSTWVFFALLAPLLWAITNLIDQIILRNYRLSPWTFLELTCLTGLWPLLIIPLWIGNPFSIPKISIALILLSGVVLFGFTSLYLYALQMSDAAVVGIIMQTAPVFSLVLGLVFLQEHYAASTYGGMLLVFLGSVIASTSEKREQSSSREFWSTKTFLASMFMLIAAFALSITYLIQDVVVRHTTVSAIFFWQSLCFYLIALIIFIVRRADILKLPFAPIALAGLGELLNTLATLSIMIALSGGPLAIVTFLTSIQPIWILLIVWFLNAVNLRALPNNANISRPKLVLACSLILGGLSFILLPDAF